MPGAGTVGSRQPTILILTETNDSHADAVARHLVLRGDSFVLFDPSDLPVRASLGFTADSHTGIATRLSVQGGSVDLRLLTSIWLRRPGRPRLPSSLPIEHRADATAQYASFLDGVWATLVGSWFPASPQVLGAQSKLRHLQIAVDVGFAIPPTIITGAVDEFLDFYRRHDGRIVSKVIGRSPVNSAESRFARYTEALTPWDVLAADKLAYAPIILQAQLPKKLELRATVVRDQVFCAAIYSQKANHSLVDWRRYDRRSTPITGYALDPVTEERCRELVARLDLSFGAIDLIITPDDQLVFVELNPNGQYLWLEMATGLPISESIATVLSSRPTDG